MPEGNSFANISLEAKIRRDTAVQELVALGSEVDAEILFIHVLVMLSMVPVDSARESTHGTVPVKIEILAYHLFPLFSTSPNRAISPNQIERGIEAMNNLLNAMMQIQAVERQPTTLPIEVEAIMARLATGVAFIRGSAYPHQTQEEISGIQGQFESWFKARVGIGPIRACALLHAIIKTQETHSNEWRGLLQSAYAKGCQIWKELRKRKKLGDETRAYLRHFPSAKRAGFSNYANELSKHSPDTIPVSREHVQIETKPSGEEWLALINLIGCSSATRKMMTAPMDVSRRPLFVLSQDRVLLCDLSNALDQLWAAFEEIARSEKTFFSGPYSSKRGIWLEEKTAVYLKRLFPEANVYQKLLYSDPDRPGGMTELDFAIHWPPFLILGEAKAAQFRLASQIGDVGKLRSDIKANIEDAFNQARRAARYIDSTSKAQFVEKITDKKLVIKKVDIEKTFILTISLHHLSQVATRLASVASLGLFRDREYPCAMSIADLETVTEFCPGPDAFLHYVDCRIHLEKETVELIADELDLFGAYLKTRLQPNRLWERNREGKYNFVWLQGFQEAFDFMVDHRRGARTEPPVIELEVPDGIKTILAELRRRREDPGARWIAYSLLGLSDTDLHALAQMMAELRRQNPTPGQLRRNTVTLKDIVITVVACRGLQAEQLYASTYQRAILEKYRRHARTSIGFGVDLADHKVFHFATWASWPWQHSPETEQLIQEDIHSVPVTGQRLPGPNEPCICGSPKKFKKCCRDRVQSRR
jgi:hypothetical protein